MATRIALLAAVVVWNGVCLAQTSPAPLDSSVNPIKELSAVLREEWSGRRVEGGCGLNFDQRWMDQVSRKPSVILVPGMLANPSSMALVRRHLEISEFPIATFRYANHLDIESSATELSRELSRLAHDEPTRDLVLVTHSMGGLIARSAIERESAGNHQVRRLIMIAPPNHGSALAELSAKELAECLSPEQRGGDVMTVVDDVVSGFLGASQEDLRPQSPLLIRLNQRPRAAGVTYSIIAGTAGPLQSDIVDLSLTLGRLIFGDDPATAPLLQTAQRLGSIDEWIDGRGDGVVSSKSARLAGVSDFISLPFAHTDFGLMEHHESPKSAALEAVKRVVAKVQSPTR